MSDADVLVVLVTAPQDKGADIARHVVESRLAACVNIIPEVRSIYRWQGKIEDDRECLMVMKTTRATFPHLMDAIRKIHPYTVPEIIALPVAAGFEGYLSWVAESTHC